MINRFFDYHNPVCDFCGTMLGAEKSDEDAGKAMRREGWEKRDGKDACRLCLQINGFLWYYVCSASTFLRSLTCIFII